MIEEWKEINGFEDYKVSNFGRVNLKTKITYGYITNYGYREVCLYNGKSRFKKKVHRLVGEAFIDNINNLYTINHKDENKENNFVENLEWMSIGDNSRYSFTGKSNTKLIGRKLSDEVKEKIRLASTGKVVSDDTKLKLKLSNTGHIVSDETRKKISDKNKGKKVSDEVKEKIREKQIILTKDKKRNEKGQFI